MNDCRLFSSNVVLNSCLDCGSGWFAYSFELLMY